MERQLAHTTAASAGLRPSSGCLVVSAFTSKCSPIEIPTALESVHAGFPSVAQDYFGGDFSLDEHIIVHPATTYIVTVAGDSMQGAGIWDGDILVVDRSLQPQAGDVVVAILDDELTVKRLMVHGSVPVLHAENPRYPDFIPQDGQTLSIWGVVTGNFHSQSPGQRVRDTAAGISRPRPPQDDAAPANAESHYDSYGWVRYP